jgi:rhodanese-related sulfurtransferase/rubrerythrin
MSEETPIETMFADEFRDYRASRREREYVLIDVRQEQEYRTNHIPGARLIPLPEIEQRIGELDPDKELLLYCHSGNRSRAAAMLVRDSGLAPRRLINLQGGISAWDGAVLPDMPSIGSLKHNLGYEETLYQALNMEKGAFLLYHGLKERFPDAPLTAALANLERMEKRHARAVFSLFVRAAGLPEEVGFEAMFASLPGDIVEGGKPLQIWVDRFSGGELSGEKCLALAETALGIELAAYDLYRSLADRAQTLPEQRDFLVLAEQEKGHVRVLSRMFKECLPEGFDA